MFLMLVPSRRAIFQPTPSLYPLHLPCPSSCSYSGPEVQRAYSCSLHAHKLSQLPTLLPGC